MDWLSPTLLLTRHEFINSFPPIKKVLWPKYKTLILPSKCWTLPSLSIILSTTFLCASSLRLNQLAELFPREIYNDELRGDLCFYYFLSSFSSWYFPYMVAGWRQLVVMPFSWERFYLGQYIYNRRMVGWIYIYSTRFYGGCKCYTCSWYRNYWCTSHFEIDVYNIIGVLSYNSIIFNVWHDRWGNP